MLVRYSHMNTLGRFEHQETTLPKMSTRVVVKTEKGLELGYLVGGFSSYKSGQFRFSEEQVKEYFGGNALWYGGFLGPLLGDLHTPLKEYPREVQEAFEYNPEKAKQLLAEAGYPRGFKYNQTTYPAQDQGLFQIVQAYWAAIGVDLEIKMYDYATRSSIVYNADAYDGAVQLFSCQSCQPDQALNYWYGPHIPWNFCRVNDPEYTSIVDTYRAELDAAERDRLYIKADQHAVSHHYQILLPAATIFNCAQSWVNSYNGEANLGQRQAGPIYARVWIDQESKKAKGH